MKRLLKRRSVRRRNDPAEVPCIDLSTVTEEAAPPPRRSWPRRMLNRLEVDRAVFYAVLARGWQFVAGPVSMLLIAAYFTPAMQGYFYAFSSLLGLHTLLELGLHAVVITIASHEWAQLAIDNDGRVTGDAAARSRLAGLMVRVILWYGGLSLLFSAGVTVAGFVFFSDRPEAGIDWRWPWVALVLLNGLLIWLWSLTSLLEGCNQVATVHRFRLKQAVLGNAVVWPGIIAGWGLWVTVASTLARLACDVWLVCVTYGRFFQSLWTAAKTPDGPSEKSVDWSREVWPLQWRMAVRSIAGFFAINLFTLVIFHYHGAEAGGRMGMTWTALTAIDAAAFAWVQTRGPLFGMLIARRDYRELDRVFFRLLGISTIVMAVAGAAFCLVVMALPRLPWELANRLAERLLPVGPTALFVVAMLLLNLPRSLSMYLLAHKRDPLLWPGLFVSTSIAIAVWWGGRTHGVMGMAVGYVLVLALLYVPLWLVIWRSCRREWHEIDRG